MPRLKNLHDLNIGIPGKKSAHEKISFSDYQVVMKFKEENQIFGKLISGLQSIGTQFIKCSQSKTKLIGL